MFRSFSIQRILLISVFLFWFSSCKKEDESLPADEIRTNCRQGVSPVKKVLFIGIDGCRTDAFLSAHSPGIDSVLVHAYFNGYCDRGPNTVSAPGWSTLLHGVFPAKHGVTSNDFPPTNYAQWPDIFPYLRQWNAALSLATVSHWDNFLRITTEEDYALPVNTDAEVRDQAIYLLNECTPDMLLLHFDDVDAAGHDDGFSPSVGSYMQAIRQTGIYIADIMQVVEAREQQYGEEWLVWIVTDHGGTGTGHGNQDNIPETRYVFLAGRLPGKPHTLLPSATNADVLPTTMHYFGADSLIPSGTDGIVLF
jgi:predicted AlkP superfamily pyrophosphatase or phosphodiesterase